MLAVGVTLVAACSTGDPGPGTARASEAAPAGIYVSVGDSYAAGFQPEGYPTNHGFADEVTRRLASGPDAVQLVNLGCPGITARGIVADVGCDSQPSAANTVAHPGSTQLQALASTLQAHPGSVRLVTVVAGGNDLMTCFTAPDALACARAAIASVRDDLATVLSTIERLAPQATVVGLTYPDVYLGLLLTGSPVDTVRARQSVAVFRDVLNPALRDVYAAASASFVDVTAQSAAYDPATVTTVLQGRTVPRSVALVCAYTHFCESGDVHPNDAGYSWYADQVVTAAGLDSSASSATPPASPAPSAPSAVPSAVGG